MTTNLPCVFLEKEGGNKELKVEDNNEFNVILAGNPSTGYGWYMSNANDVKSSNVIEILNLNEHGSADYVTKAHLPGKFGIGGAYYFKFKVKNGVGKELPKLTFEYKRPWEKDVSPHGKAEITLKL